MVLGNNVNYQNPLWRVPFLKTTPYTSYDSSRIRNEGEEQIDNPLTWNEGVREKTEE